MWHRVLRAVTILVVYLAHNMLGLDIECLIPEHHLIFIRTDYDISARSNRGLLKRQQFTLACLVYGVDSFQTTKYIILLCCVILVKGYSIAIRTLLLALTLNSIDMASRYGWMLTQLICLKFGVVCREPVGWHTPVVNLKHWGIDVDIERCTKVLTKGVYRVTIRAFETCDIEEDIYLLSRLITQCHVVNALLLIAIFHIAQQLAISRYSFRVSTTIIRDPNLRSKAVRAVVRHIEDYRAVLITIVEVVSRGYTITLVGIGVRTICIVRCYTHNILIIRTVG